MREVRIYDGEGNLKKIITEKMLDRRSNLILSAGPRDKRWLKKALRDFERTTK